MAGTTVMVIDSGVRRELADGEYLKRRQEIETALIILRKVTGPLREAVENGFEGEFGRRPTVHHLHSAGGAGTYPIGD